MDLLHQSKIKDRAFDEIVAKELGVVLDDQDTWYSGYDSESAAKEWASQLPDA